MRQVGVLCAAALVALQENVGKLESDHKNARFFAGKCHTMLTDSQAILSTDTDTYTYTTH